MTLAAPLVTSTDPLVTNQLIRSRLKKKKVISPLTVLLVRLFWLHLLNSILPNHVRNGRMFLDKRLNVFKTEINSVAYYLSTYNVLRNWESTPCIYVVTIYYKNLPDYCVWLISIWVQANLIFCMLTYTHSILCFCSVFVADQSTILNFIHHFPSSCCILVAEVGEQEPERLNLSRAGSYRASLRYCPNTFFIKCSFNHFGYTFIYSALNLMPVNRITPVVFYSWNWLCYSNQ